MGKDLSNTVGHIVQVVELQSVVLVETEGITNTKSMF